MGDRTRGPGQTARHTVDAARAHLDGVDRVLDYGCGDGVLTMELAAVVGRVDAIDTSAGMIEAGRRRADRDGAANVEFVHTGLFDDAYANGDFDAVVAFNVLHYVADLDAVAQRVAEILKPGGLFVSSTACLAERWSLLRGAAALAVALRLLPPMTALRLSDIEAAATGADLSVVERTRLSRLPDYFVVARKS